MRPKKTQMGLACWLKFLQQKLNKTQLSNKSKEKEMLQDVEKSPLRQETQ